MKSLHIFRIILIKREEKFQDSLWEDERSKASLEYEKPRVKCNPNEEIHGVTLEELAFLVPNNEVNQLCRHTCPYLKSISQVPAIYQIPRARSSQRRTRPYGENETLAATIDDVIIDTISEIRDPIATIEH
jgi:hypothetical protein